MNYYSTRDRERAHGCSLREAAMMGLAPDGGLFVPERIPQADMALAERLASESYAALAGYLAGLFFGGDFDSQAVQRELDGLYDFPVPLRVVGRGRYTLELFHGPTCAFKDFGAGFMGRMTGLLGAADEKLVILTATSGDTGSAVAHGFHNVPGVEVVVLYPEGKISRLQECQMTALGGNIHPLRVAGTFDDCQRLVKELFADAPFRKRRRVTSANSINLLRWIPQAFYYFYGYCQWRQATGGDRPVVVVPSGNYGNLAAGMLARRMGLPLGGFVAASNVNDVVPEFIRTASTARGRRCGLRPMRWMSAHRAISNGCCGSATAIRRCCAPNWRDSAATMPRSAARSTSCMSATAISPIRTAPSAMRPRRPWTSRVFTSPRRIPPSSERSSNR